MSLDFGLKRLRLARAVLGHLLCLAALAVGFVLLLAGHLLRGILLGNLPAETCCKKDIVQPYVSANTGLTTHALGKAGKTGFLGRRTKGETCYPRRMERPDATELSHDDLEKLRQKLATMSVTGLRDFYFFAHFRCRLGGAKIPAAREIQELVQDGKRSRDRANARKVGHYE